MSQYSFITHWLVGERSDRLWDLLSDGLNRGDPLPWWGMVQAISSDTESIRLQANSGLGYRLDFHVFDLHEVPGRKLSFRVDGDLDGDGVVMFTGMGPQSILTIHWHVSVQKSWMRRSQWLLRPVFYRAHTLVMAIGHRRLKKWLRENAHN